MFKASRKGFTLIELMIVVAIIAVLSMLSIPSFMRFLAKAKRAEVYVNLGALAMAQKAYHAEHNKYSAKLTGPDSVHWKPGDNFKYSYGFASGDNFIGELKTPVTELKDSKVNDDSFTIVAAGYIYGKDKADIVSVDQNNKITIIQDALQ